MKAHRYVSILIAVILGSGVSASSPQDSVIEIPIRDTKLGGVRLAMPPQATGRVPVVIFVVTGDETAMGGVRSLSYVMSKEGIAALRYPVPLVAAPETSGEFEAAVVTVAATVSFLRNDVRFSTITVAGDAGGASIAAVAARVARADTSTSFTLDNPSTVTRAVRDLDLPGAPKPRRNPGQRASLRDTTIATIDGARISIEYGRPSKRNRVIWGNLVKWGGWWMPGADEATSFTTNRALTFGSLAVPAGDYTLYTAPGEAEFMLIVNRETGQFHTVYNRDRDLGRVTMTKETADPASERLTFVIEPRAGGGGALKLIWDDRAYVAPFTVTK
jgi:hypothetical protein